MTFSEMRYGCNLRVRVAPRPRPGLCSPRSLIRIEGERTRWIELTAIRPDLFKARSVHPWSGAHWREDGHPLPLCTRPRVHSTHGNVQARFRMLGGWPDPIGGLISANPGVTARYSRLLTRAQGVRLTIKHLIAPTPLVRVFRSLLSS